jgi:iron complex transport system substrate-binding protein
VPENSKKQMKRIFTILTVFTLGCSITSCNNNPRQEQAKENIISDSTRIVSLNGTTTEVLCALGLEKNIVGVDITSTYPESVMKLPKVGHNRNMSAEAILALKPDVVVGIEETVKPELAEQIRSANVRLMLYKLEGTVEGSKTVIAAVADSFKQTDKTTAIHQQIDADLQAKATLPDSPKVMFIYARGAGTVMAAGEHTYPNSMIKLSGAKNAMSGFEDFKPVTSESLVAANPDVILMFDSGLESLGGVNGLLQIQGMSQTNAGKNKRVIEMDGQYLTGFGPRIGKAIADLSKKLNEIYTK